MATNKKDETIHVVEVQRGAIEVCVIGTTPLILNRMSEKAKRELLLPAGPKNKAEKASTLKHDPIEEFRASAHVIRSEAAPTLLATPSSAWKGAIRGAALDQKGASKAQIGRLCYVENEFVPVYGMPQLHMTIVRQAGMNKTPDVRSRVIVAEWAARLQISFVAPLLNETIIATLLSSAGFTQGVGDWRPEKGAGNYGQFRVCNADDAQFLAITKNWGRAEQQNAMDNPTPYDDGTEELLTWFEDTVSSRGKTNLRRIA
jgi:hypothetical protein